MDVVDVAVIGGGAVGAACAGAAAARGLQVAIFEPGPDPAAASPASAGMLAAQIEPTEDALVGLSVRARDLYEPLAPALGETTGIDIGFWRAGIAAVAFDDAAADRLKEGGPPAPGGVALRLARGRRGARTLAGSGSGLPRRPVRARGRCGRPAGADPRLPRRRPPDGRGAARGTGHHGRHRDRPDAGRDDASRNDGRGPRRPRGRRLGTADRWTAAAAPGGAGARADGRYRLARWYPGGDPLSRSRLRARPRR